MAARIAGIPAALVVLVVATGCAGDGTYAGLSEEEAKTQARAWRDGAQTFETFEYAEAARAKTPGGEDAWLVRLVYEGGSLDSCAYVRRDDGRTAEVRGDGVCRHWKYD